MIEQLKKKKKATKAGFETRLSIQSILILLMNHWMWSDWSLYEIALLDNVKVNSHMI